MSPYTANFVFLVEMGFLHVGQADLKLPTLGDTLTSASRSARITGLSRCAQPVFFVETKVYHVAQANLNLSDSSKPPASASQSAGITSMSHQV